MASTPQPRLICVDGRDALLYVLVRPNPDSPEKPMVEAAANGISKRSAAFLLRQIADLWDAEAAQEADDR